MQLFFFYKNITILALQTNQYKVNIYQEGGVDNICSLKEINQIIHTKT